MHLASLYRFALKSAAGESLIRVETDRLGLRGDRRWMLVDPAGNFLSQRVLPGMARLRATWLDDDRLHLQAADGDTLEVTRPADTAARCAATIWGTQVQVPDAGKPAADWLARVLGTPCRLVYLPEEQGIQVDTDYAQPGQRTAFSDGFPFLLIGQASLDDLSARVGRPLDMLRFRPNLVIAGSTPYAEDNWQRIRVGEVVFRVVKPCSRCAITTLNPATGERADSEPLATLATYRKGEGGVFFGQNLIAEGTGRLEVGMPVDVLD